MDGSVAPTWSYEDPRARQNYEREDFPVWKHGPESTALTDRCAKIFTQL
jgi:hypothetical protein